ncbi:hypothetical protein BHM03_00046047, partial [Ensete ventricosum]
TIPPNAKIEYCFSGSSKTKPNTFRFPRGVLAPVLFDLRSPSPDASGSLMAIAPWPSSLSLLAGDRLSFPSFRPSQELRLPWSSNPYLVRRSPAHCCSGKIFRGGRALRSAEELCHELREFISATGLAENRVPSMKELCENGRSVRLQSSVDSLHIKAVKFRQTGELDTLEDLSSLLILFIYLMIPQVKTVSYIMIWLRRL